MENTIRVRFAPSPTGPLHIGGVRTALYNYLFARKNGGKMILRIEDTDRTRFVEGAEEYIIKSLNWAGIVFDEGVHVGGPYAPYKQSERTHIYKEYIQKLLDNKCAYYAFDTAEELEKIRNDYQNQKITFQYDASTRLKMKNALTLTAAETEELIKSGHPYVIRFLIPENKQIIVNDLIRGEVIVNTSQLDDKVLFKSDGLPTYHLANVVDDHLMKISHVIRGEEWLPSAPLHVLLYQSFGWELTMPFFAHLPLLLKPEGNGKLSKRDGDRLGFPVFPMQWTDPATKEVSSGYKEAGYFPYAFVNMLALLGWNPGIEQEIFTREELIQYFSIERISKAGAKFSPEKARWFNQQYLRNMPTNELVVLFKEVLKENNIETQDKPLFDIVELVKERVVFVKDIWNESQFFFVKPDTIDEQIVKKRCNEKTIEVLKTLTGLIQKISDWNLAQIHSFLHKYIEDNNLNAGQIMVPLRLSLVGALKGPDVADIVYILGKNETIDRVNIGKSMIENILSKK